MEHQNLELTQETLELTGALDFFLDFVKYEFTSVMNHYNTRTFNDKLKSAYFHCEQFIFKA